MSTPQWQIDTAAVQIATRALTKIENHESICAVKHESIQTSLRRIETRGNATLWLLITGLVAIIGAFIQGRI